MAPSTSQWRCLAIGIISFLLNLCQSLPIDYNNTGGPVKGKLNVHLVPHTHDDLGWLKTVDQYYVGSNCSIQAAAVQYILDSVVAALQEDPNKKFIYVESGFFARWWREQNEKKKKIVRKLVASGQFEFINGGYVMHDEATTMYMDMIDQTTLGHRFLKKEFGIVPRTGWQIDPFGHSAVQAYLLTAEVAFPIRQSFCWYNASDGNTKTGQNGTSGAYIFRPNSTRCFPVGDSRKQVTQSVIKGEIVSEIYQQFSPWVSQVVRLYKNAGDAEIDFMVGPIPIDDDLGKEVITQFTTNIPSNKEFFTDSNGRDFLKRVRNYRKDWNLSVHELIAGNYYPLNLGIYLKDNETEFSLLVDRAVGGSSIFDGELELMLHRRLLHDDDKGVSENLNETVCFNNNRTCEGLSVQGKIYLSVNPVEKASEWRRTKGQKALIPLQISFATIPDGEINQIKKPKYSALAEGYELPPNVAILTLQDLDDRQTLLRLAHLYEVDESAKFSKSATIDLYKLFPNHKVNKIVELNLSAVKEKSQMRRLNWKVEGDENTFRGTTSRPAIKDGEHIIELAPFEIRTFQLEIDD